MFGPWKGETRMRTQSVLHLLEGAEITPKKRREAEAQIWELRKKINRRGNENAGDCWKQGGDL